MSAPALDAATAHRRRPEVRGQGGLEGFEGHARGMVPAGAAQGGDEVVHQGHDVRARPMPQVQQDPQLALRRLMWKPLLLDRNVGLREAVDCENHPTKAATSKQGDAMLIPPQLPS